jgi:hypothetical protein
MTSFDYAQRAAVLLNEASRFEDSLSADESAQQAAVRDLLEAADMGAGPTVAAFDPGIGPPPPPAGLDGVSSILFDLQSANLLMAGAIERKEIAAAAPAGHFQRARQDIETTRNEITTPETIPFELSWTVKSSTSAEAANEFRKWSGKLLDEIVDESADTMERAVNGLRKLDPAKVSDALGALLKPLPFATEAGVLVRKGIQKLRQAIEALVALFGTDAFEAIKGEIDKLRNASGDIAHKLLEAVLGVPAVRQRIEAIAAVGKDKPEAWRDTVDRASNSLIALADDFTRYNRLLRALIGAIDLAVVLLVALHFAGPWFALAIGVAYLSTIGGTILVAIEYTGVRQLLRWTKGVEQVAEGIGAP